MSRSVLITGSAGHLGRALRDAFEAEGDVVTGLDLPGMQADIAADLDVDEHKWEVGQDRYDVVVCNAKTQGWKAHHVLAQRATSAIINIGSIYGVLGNDPQMYEGTEVESTPPWYAAAKGAMVALTKWQAANLAPVRSNIVCPGGILRGHSDEFRTRYSEKVPLKRMATEADIVPMVLFLASEKASYITGAIIPVDGGYSSW